jgi:hypothetical protein
MKLTKISYSSAVFFGAIGFVSMFALGLLGMVSPEAALIMGSMTTLPFSGVALAALTQAVSAYIGVIFSILIYNLVAQKFPISWETKK